MNVDLAPKDKEDLEAKVEAGYSINEEEAIRRMRDSDNFNEEFYAEVMVGEQQIIQGEVVAYTPGLMEEIRQNALTRAARGERPFGG